jgi:hypothetical protein
MFNESQESNIILQGVLLTGIKDIKFDSSVTESSTKLINNQGIKRKVYGPPKTTCSFSKAYNGKDFIQSLTGVGNLSGQFIYKNNAINFSDAAISNYSLNLDQDGFAEISVTMQIFGNMEPTTNLQQLLSAADDFPILDQTPTISHFDLDNKNSAIKSLSYEASLNPKSSNNIGSITSSNVNFTSPTVHNISANIEMLEQDIEDVTGFAENDKLTKNIDIIFAPEENRTSIDRILEIQSTVRDIESSGIKLDDLDFSVGSCAYNAFQFNKSSISNQNLNSKAGEVVQLNNQYNAYTNIKKITGSIPTPAEFPTCADHLQKLENNLNISLDRLSLQFFTDVKNYESRTTGETNLNFWEFIAAIRQPSTGEDFELENTGSYKINNYNLTLWNPGASQLKTFETKTTGLTNEDLFLRQTLYHNIVTFEDQPTGFTGLGSNLIIPPDNSETFEGFSAGTDSLDSTQFLDFYLYNNIETFEPSGAGTVSLKDFDAFEFAKLEDFEAFDTGEINSNLYNL